MTENRRPSRELREAAMLMRSEHGKDHPRHEMWAALAEFLDEEAALGEGLSPELEQTWTRRLLLDVARGYLKVARHGT